MSDEGGRQAWEARWQRRQAADFDWHHEGVPALLTELLREQPLPSGAALDLGCGDGVVTGVLADTFHPALGIDIAFSALLQAKQRHGAGNVAFATADASRIPCRSAAFAFIFDRGCLQNLPRERWPNYFEEIDRLLLPGGVLQVFCCKASNDIASPFSKSGLAARAAWLRGHRSGPQFASSSYIRKLLPHSLEVVRESTSAVRLKSGNPRTEIYGVYQKRSA